MSPVMPERLNLIEGYSLKSGQHDSLEEGACAMELVSYLAGEKFSDHPACVCPALGAFVRGWNDGLPSDEERDRILKPFLPRLIGTESGKALAERRGYMALDWLIRVHTPKWLDLVPSLASHAKALRDLEDIADMAGAVAAGEKVRAAWAAARDAAWDTAGDAAGDAAWDTAGDAAWDTAWAAAGAAAWAAAWAAARAAARAAAWAAAWAAARDAARDAAWAALKPTTQWLQLSAANLLDRMISEGT